MHTESSQGWGGQEIRILTEAAGLRGRGHEVLVVAPASARITREAHRHGVPAIPASIERKSVRGLLAMRQAMAMLQADVINTHSSTDSWLAALARTTLPGAPPLVRTRHVSAPVPANPATRWLYRTATTRVVTTGEAIRRHLIERLALAPGRVSAVPTGIEASRFVPGDRVRARERLGLPAGAPIVGIVATLRSWKGHRYLFDAVAAITEAPVMLVVVGDGPQRQALEAHARTLALGDRVRFAGDQADVVPWLQALDVFALPSFANEGVPQALLQAMFCGVPCVTTDAGAIPEIARHGETALVIPARSSEALRGAIASLLADRATCGALAQRAQELVRRRFTLDAMLDRMEAIFTDVASSARQTPAASTRA